MIKKLAYLFLFSVITFGFYQVIKYTDKLSFIFNNADYKNIKSQAILDKN